MRRSESMARRKLRQGLQLLKEAASYEPSNDRADLIEDFRHEIADTLTGQPPMNKYTNYQCYQCGNAVFPKYHRADLIGYSCRRCGIFYTNGESGFTHSSSKNLDQKNTEGKTPE